jgi:galactofuranose transport system ATP-binding protein
VAIARAVELSGKVLILDEPTASLDAAEVRSSSPSCALREEGLGIIFVSHFLNQVFELCDRVTVLRNGRISSPRRPPLDRVRLISHMLGRELEEVERHDRANREARVIRLPNSSCASRAWAAPAWSSPSTSPSGKAR